MSWAELAMRPLRSVRGRTTVAATLVVGLALVGAGFVLVDEQRDALTDNVDATLRLRADDIESLLSQGALPDSVSVSDDEVALVQVIADDGRVIAASPNIAGQPPVLDQRPEPGSSLIVAVPELPIDDDEFRVLARTFDAPDGRVTIYVASSIEEVAESVETLSGFLQLGIPAVLLVVAASTWLLVGRALAPVEAIRREVASISSRDLARRVPKPSSRDEVARLAETMNAMLERLQAASERQDQFVADAAHELRSPLAAMRAEIEVDLQSPRQQDPRAALMSLHAEVIRMQRLVDDLLLLARSDADGLERKSEEVDLDDIVLDAARRARAQAPIRVDTSAVSAAAVRGDLDQLSRAVTNLLDNAARHAVSTVRLALSETDGAVALTVTDDGPGIPGADAERVFERFTRLDSARTRGEGGAGLGLAITRAIVEAHGGTVVLDTRNTQGARFVVLLPAASDAGEPAIAV